MRITDTGPITLGGDLRGLLEDISDTWTSQIQQRTRSGRDADGRAMRLKRDGSRSTLHDSGRMLRSLRPTVHDRGFKIAPTGRRNATVAAIHQASGRAWIGADDRQIDEARAAVADALQGKQMTDQDRDSRSARPSEIRQRLNELSRASTTLTDDQRGESRRAHDRVRQ